MGFPATQVLALTPDTVLIKFVSKELFAAMELIASKMETLHIALKGFALRTQRLLLEH